MKVASRLGTSNPARMCAARAGNPAGDSYVYDTASGTRAASYGAAAKSGGAARHAALSEDGRHLLIVRGTGYVLR